VLFALLAGGVAVSEGVGRTPAVPAGDVAIVEGAPPGISEISKAEFDRALAELAEIGGLEGVPKPGDEEYERLKGEVMGSLISSIWLQAEGEEMGLEAPRAVLRDKAARDEFFVEKIEDALREEVPAPSQAEVAAYYEEGLAKKLAGARVALTAQRHQEHYSEFDREFRDTWHPRTHCAKGYVMESCGNYPPFAHPALPGCNAPGEPTGTGCPAPVPQRYVAIPGTVTPFDPDGDARLQGPTSSPAEAESAFE
jgi:hypothetical protein